ncbi:hypothetical protein N9E35_01350 [Candidatus Marinimicrobia bacterium]|nr:hypothetical protein [Candidatus Neomarinimicrobiota bacterium]
MKITIEVDDEKVFSMVERIFDKLRIETRPILVTTDERSDFNKGDVPEEITILPNSVAVCMDEAGKPTKFKNRCSICDEVGRNSRSHRKTMRDGTYHWVLRPGESEEE